MTVVQSPICDTSQIAASDQIGSHEAARILGVSLGSVCRWVQTGYLPTLVYVPGTGGPANVYDRAVVADLAARRAEAKRVLDWQHGAIA